jgi:tRNA pseudouridine38-40 synthase
MTTGSKIESTVRTVTRSEWSREANLLYYDVSANGFLYNMVRILVGTMLEIGSGNLPVNAISHALETKNRLDAGPTAPAHGLMLMRVVYDGFDTEEVLSR